MATQMTYDDRKFQTVVTLSTGTDTTMTLRGIRDQDAGVEVEILGMRAVVDRLELLNAARLFARGDVIMRGEIK